MIIIIKLQYFLYKMVDKSLKSFKNLIHHTLYILQINNNLVLPSIIIIHVPLRDPSHTSPQDCKSYLIKMAECKAYKEKVIELFTPSNAKDISLNHLYKNIIVNPKALFNLVESNFLLQKKTENLALYYEVTHLVYSSKQKFLISSIF